MQLCIDFTILSNTETGFMDPQMMAIVLLLAAFALIFAELFLPSGGIIGVMCVVCIGASIYFAHMAWYENYPVRWWGFIGTAGVLTPAMLYAAYHLLTKTSLGNRVLQNAPSLEEVTPHQAESERLNTLLGKRGHALNLMSPGGLVMVEGERLHATGESLLIEPNTEIIIIAIKGTRVVVRPVTENDIQKEALDDFTDGDSDESGDDDDPLESNW